MNKDQIQIVKHDLEHILELAEQITPEQDSAVLLELVKSMQAICQRDLRIIGRMQ